MVIIEIGGVPYELVHTDDGSPPELRLWNSGGTGYVGFKSPSLADMTIKIFTLPGDFAENGLQGHLVTDEDGIIQVLSPYPYVGDADISFTLSQLITKVNEILAALRSKYIIQPTTKISTPAPARGVATARNSVKFTPAPATATGSTTWPG